MEEKKSPQEPSVLSPMVFHKPSGSSSFYNKDTIREPSSHYDSPYTYCKGFICINFRELSVT